MTKSFIITFLFFISIRLNAQNILITGQQNIDPVAADFLLIPPDARASGMGSSGVATSPDMNAAYWNPAKVVFNETKYGISFSYVPWLRALMNGINHLYITGFYKAGPKECLSASYNSLYGKSGFLTATPLNINNFAIDFSYSRFVSTTSSVGLTLKYIESNTVANSPGKALAAIAGGVSFYNSKPVNLVHKNTTLRFGINIRDIGTKMGTDTLSISAFLPANLSFGESLEMDLNPLHSVSVCISLDKLLVPTPPVLQRTPSGAIIPNIAYGTSANVSVMQGMIQAFYDAPGGFREELKEIIYAVGMEYSYDKQFFFRTGYFHEATTKGNRAFFTLGSGLSYNRFKIDFSYLIPEKQRSSLENTLAATFSYQ